MSQVMDLDMSKMTSEMKILNYNEIMKEKDNFTCEDIRIHERSVAKKKIAENSKALAKELETLEAQLMKGIKFDPWLRPIKYHCWGCDWSITTTRIFTKCPICKGSIDAKFLFDKKGNKLEEPTVFKSGNLGQAKGDANITEMKGEILKGAEKKLKSKIKEKSKVKTEVKENKTYKIWCTNNAPGKCGFAYETNDAPNGTHKHKQCPRCNFPTRHEESKPIKKVSRYDR